MHLVCRRQFFKLTKQRRLLRLLVSKNISFNVPNKENKTPVEYLTNEELKQILLSEQTKTRTKEKEKEKKKDDTFDIDEEEIADEFAE